MDTITIDVHTGSTPGSFDLTPNIAAFVAGHGDGLVNVFVPHATAGVAIIERGAGSDADLIDRIDDLLPRQEQMYRHRHGSRGHGADHVLPAFVAPSTSIPVFDGVMALGTWQSVLLVDTNVDNPVRQVRFSFLSSS
jgi:secondary thiamine-phosphate synthase enzyme